ncbi:MAG: carbamoyl-phosphate synthase large subunit [Rickettsiaceae bacterium H1]|nr:carbamoyl-phosphate synthase large subunit [Rickettsiaceae bacterium H1]
MPKRTDIRSILIIGAGPIVIGQACEFDYSGTQACKALKEEGYKVILVNSNPATIMTDPEIADVTYIEPITKEFVGKIIAKELPDALLPTVGGQTALNCAMSLANEGVLAKYNVELIGANREAIEKAENRKFFSAVLDKIGLKYPKNTIISNMEQAHFALEEIGLPIIIRPSFTLGGAGGGVAYNKEEFLQMATRGLEMSPIHEIQVDQSIIGWKEFEMEVIRDRNDNCIIVCSIENVDPMGVHTGDSITVAPALTLRDREYQQMRDASFAIMREIGVETGGSNVQFAVNPDEDESLMVIEMNPRVSRSSALASKATGFPIAKVAAKLAVGYTLDEIRNDCVPSILASFEPTIDYIVTKIPRFNFDKFGTVKPELSSTMKSVGEVMAIGRSFSESLQKALCSLETGLTGLNEILPKNLAPEDVRIELAKIRPNRLLVIADAMRYEISIDEIYDITKYDKWFLAHIARIISVENNIKEKGLSNDLLGIKQMGFSDARLEELTGNKIRELRKEQKVIPVYKHVDSCAAEFDTETAYMYSTYENGFECEAKISNKQKVIVLGSGPNRIGQGIEFDYVCVHGVQAIQEMGIEAIMINCNPETVSTDYDISNRLYFSPLMAEFVLDIIEKEEQKGNLLGVIVQFGGQTPLKLAKILESNGIKILGTDCAAIDHAEDRDKFKQLLKFLGLKQPKNAICYDIKELYEKTDLIEFPLVIRPSYVLGGQSMRVIGNYNELENYLIENKKIFDHGALLLDSFLTDAIELDLDLITDGEQVYVAGISEHIEEAGIHSGDSSCVLPPDKIGVEIRNEIKKQAESIAIALKAKGLVNIQFAVKDNDIYVLEVNPRASRTIPFIAKATNTKLAQIATQIILGKKLSEFNLSDLDDLQHISVKSSVFPFSRFLGSDILLGPEMKSTGEVMGIDKDFGSAFAKAHIGGGNILPLGGTVFISVKDADKEKTVKIVETLLSIGFTIVATGGTARFLNNKRINADLINKVRQGRPHIVDMLLSDKISLVINTSEGSKSIADSASIRTTTLAKKIPYCTTMTAAFALTFAIKKIKSNGFSVKSLQKYFAD